MADLLQAAAQPQLRGPLGGRGRGDDAASTRSTPCAICCWTRTCRSRTSRRAATATRCPSSWPTRCRWSAATPCCSATTRARAPTAAFPVILAEFVREERYLSLPEAIRKMTSFPAQRLGLPDRGLLRDGIQGRHRGLRPGHGQGARPRAPTQAVPDRHRLRDRQRQGRRGRRSTPARWPAARCAAAAPTHRTGSASQATAARSSGNWRCSPDSTIDLSARTTSPTSR